VRRHGIAGPAVHFGMALWPYDVLLRFGYDLPEHEHRWPGRWFDDQFQAAAIDLRATTAKLLIAVPRMDAACQQLAGPGGTVAGMRPAVEAAPMAVDVVAVYLRRLPDDLAAVVPCCFGAEGRAMAADRRSLSAMLDSEQLRKADETLAELLVPPSPLAAVLDPAFAAHTAELYAVSGAAGDAPPLPGAAKAALTESARRTLAAADEIGQALGAACPWLDAVLDRLIAIVCGRAEDGPELRNRWAEPDWSIFATSVPVRDLCRTLPELGVLCTGTGAHRD
jgi:hypothetical protein